MKKLLLTFAVLATAITASAYDFKVAGFYYNILSQDEMTCEVTSGDNKYSGDIDIPEFVIYNSRRYSVIAIGEKAFWASNVKSVVIPNSVIKIKDNAFGLCVDMTSVELPYSVKTIGEWAFGGCTRLTSVDIPNSVTTIESWAFRNCSSLTTLVIGESVTNIGSDAFVECTNLKEIQSLNPTPPRIDVFLFDCFSNETFQNSVLYVPLQSYQRYKAAAGWRKFRNIEGY